jgi:HlyD family secretion protein
LRRLDYSSTTTLERGNILTAKVKRSDINAEVEGYGKLRSKQQLLLTAPSVATVREIVLRPGENVSPKDVIIRLDNPELQLQIDSAKRSLNQEQGNLRQLKLSQKKDELKEKSALAGLVMQYQSIRLERKAKEELVAKGIVSSIEFQRVELEEKLLKEQEYIQRDILAQLMKAQEEGVSIQQDKISQSENLLLKNEQQLDRLDIRVDFEGVLQELTVELGQSLTLGQKIGMVGSTSDLLAEIKVPQNQAQDVVRGQKVVVKTRNEQISGLVSRVDPRANGFKLTGFD